MAATKKPYHHGNLKAVLSSAALQLVGEIGLGAFTLREVARRAGVSHNAPYRHFRKREDLFAALATDGFHQWNNRLLDVLAADLEPAARLHMASRAYLEFAFESPARFAVMFHADFDREAYGEYVEAYSESLQLLIRLIAPCAGLTAGSLDAAGDLVWSAVHGIAELGLARRLREGNQAELERLAGTAIDSLLLGMPGILERPPQSRNTIAGKATRG